MQHKVKMLKTTHGVDDGKVIPDTFREGEEYEIGESLLGEFVNMGVVELVGIESHTRGTGKAVQINDDLPPVEQRETKVTAPAETKPAKPAAKKKH